MIRLTLDIKTGKWITSPVEKCLETTREAVTYRDWTYSTQTYDRPAWVKKAKERIMKRAYSDCENILKNATRKHDTMKCLLDKVE